MSSSKENQIIERLMIENSRLNKELIDIRGGKPTSNLEQEASYVIDLFRQNGICSSISGMSLTEIANEALRVVSELSEMNRENAGEIAGLRKEHDLTLDALLGVSVDTTATRTPSVKVASKLRAVVELVRMRLERLEKLHADSEISRLFTEIDRFITLTSKQ